MRGAVYRTAYMKRLGTALRALGACYLSYSGSCRVTEPRNAHGAVQMGNRFLLAKVEATLDTMGVGNLNTYLLIVLTTIFRHTSFSLLMKTPVTFELGPRRSCLESAPRSVIPAVRRRRLCLLSDRGWSVTKVDAVAFQVCAAERCFLNASVTVAVSSGCT